jgi:hypothetical protein
MPERHPPIRQELSGVTSLQQDIIGRFTMRTLSRTILSRDFAKGRCVAVCAGFALCIAYPTASAAPTPVSYIVSVSMEDCNASPPLCVSTAFVTASDGSNIRRCVAQWKKETSPVEFVHTFCRKDEITSSSLAPPVTASTYEKHGSADIAIRGLWRVSQINGKAEYCVLLNGRGYQCQLTPDQ